MQKRNLMKPFLVFKKKVNFKIIIYCNTVDITTRYELFQSVGQLYEVHAPNIVVVAITKLCYHICHK